MKKLITGILLFSFAAANSFTLSAGDDKKAKGILDELSKSTKSYSSICADYNLTITDKNNKQLENQNGKLKVKGKKFRLEIPGLVVVSDGKTIWNHNHNSGEVGIKDYQEDNELSPSNILFMYEKGYTYSLEKQEGAGENKVFVILLTPTSKKKVESVRLYVDGNKKKITKMKILKSNKNTETYEIKKFVSNSVIPDKEFTFDTSGFAKDNIIDEREND